MSKMNTAMENLQTVRKSTKTTPKAKVPVKLQKQTIKVRPICSTTEYINQETLPKNKRQFDWACKAPPSPPAKLKIFITKPVKKLPVRKKCTTPSPTQSTPMTSPVHTPSSTSNDLRDMQWLIHALDEDTISSL